MHSLQGRGGRGKTLDYVVGYHPFNRTWKGLGGLVSRLHMVYGLQGKAGGGRG